MAISNSYVSHYQRVVLMIPIIDRWFSTIFPPFSTRFTIFKGMVSKVSLYSLQFPRICQAQLVRNQMFLFGSRFSRANSQIFWDDPVKTTMPLPSFLSIAIAALALHRCRWSCLMCLMCLMCLILSGWNGGIYHDVFLMMYLDVPL